MDLHSTSSNIKSNSIEDSNQCNSKMVEMKLTNDKATQIVLSLLKAHGIKRVIASPGTTNIALVASMQIDPWFEIYSAVDERGAAYMAVGMSAASGEPVVITCTEATASRNYYSGMTEAFYRKLPVLAITGTHGRARIGHLEPQVIDRSVKAKDACRMSIDVERIKDEADELEVIINVNKALLELTRNGGGPVHINLQAAIDAGFTTDVLPNVRKIYRITYPDIDKSPTIDSFNHIAIFVGSHVMMSDKETESIENFCKANNAVVLCDITSGYHGKYKITPQLLFSQHNPIEGIPEIDLLIHIGEVSADYYTQRYLKPKNVWRVSEDGEVRDLFGSLTTVFEVREQDFFTHYTSTFKSSEEFYKLLSDKSTALFHNMPELPFSNFWIAQELYKRLDVNTIIHTSILNSNRACNLSNNATLSNEIRCNVGGFGIDGAISTVMGSALVNKDKLHLLVIGDLAFFYDMNSLGNRHFPHNIRILLINNAGGTEFRNYDHPGSMWGNEAAAYIAAAGHFANKSKEFIKNFSKDLGFDYYTASSKHEFIDQINVLLNPEYPKGVIFEVFTNSEDESAALLKLRGISTLPSPTLSSRLINKAKSIIKNI